MTNFKNISDYELSLTLFATAENTTASSSEGNDLTPEMKTYYSEYLIDTADPELVYDRFAQKQPIPKNRGKSIEFRKYSPLAKATTPLTEGVTPDGQAIDVSTVTATVSQYGGWMQLPDMLLLSAIDNNMVQVTKLLGSQAGRTLDTVTREVVCGGTSVMYAGSKLAREELSKADKLTVSDIFKAVRFLKTQHAEKIDNSYVGIIHPDVAFDLMTSEGWLDVHKYAGTTEIYEGEIGKLGGVRFVETTEAKIFAGEGAEGCDVYATMIVGANAYGVTEIQGGGLEHIVKQLGSGGSADPLNQRASAGWKAVKAAARLVEGYMVRIESASTFDSGEN